MHSWSDVKAVNARRTIDEAPDAPVPDNLAEQIRAKISGKALAWDDAIWSLVQTTESSTIPTKENNDL